MQVSTTQHDDRMKVMASKEQLESRVMKLPKDAEHAERLVRAESKAADAVNFAMMKLRKTKTGSTGSMKKGSKIASIASSLRGKSVRQDVKVAPIISPKSREESLEDSNDSRIKFILGE